MHQESFRTLQQAIDRARRVIETVVPVSGQYVAGLSTPADAVRPHAARIFAAWDTLVAAVVDARGRLAVAATDRLLSAEGKSRKVAAIVAEVNTAISVELAAMRTAVDRIDAILTPISGPTRPTPADAAQEAALANLRSDLRMVLDPIRDGADVVRRLSSSLRTALGEGDELSAWLIASSPWPKLYLEARDLTDHTAALDAALAEVLDNGSSGDAAIARRILAVVDDDYGLRDVVRVAEHYTRMELADLGRVE